MVALYPGRPIELALVFVFSFAVSTASARIIDQIVSPPDTVALFLQTTNVSSIQILRPATPTSDVGRATVGRSPLTIGPDASSRQLGTWNNLDVETGTGPPFSSVQILSTIKYDDGVFRGSIALHGVVDFNEEFGELAVVGGTGNFAGVQGYAVREIISITTNGVARNAFKYTLNLFHRKGAVRQQYL